MKDFGKAKAAAGFKASFVDLDRRVEYASPYKGEQQRGAAIKAIVCNEGEVVVHEGEIVTV